MFHERCWVLMTRILDIRLIKENMSLFVEVATGTKWWRNEKDLGLLGKYDDETEWMVRKAAADSDLYLQDQASFIRWYSWQWRCDEDKHALRDPWKVLEVWDHMEDEQLRFGEEEQTEQTVEYENKSIVVGRSLPPELIMGILDFLPDSEQIRFLMWAFPHWATRVPFSYWRARFIRELMLEDEEKDIPNSTELNWRRLYYMVERIHRESHGLRNRRRIMTLLETIRDKFLKKLGNK